MIRIVDWEESKRQNTVIYRKVTPKQFACYQLAGAVQAYTENADLLEACPELTEREAASIWKQTHKLEQRLYKLLRQV